MILCATMPTINAIIPNYSAFERRNENSSLYFMYMCDHIKCYRINTFIEYKHFYGFEWALVVISRILLCIRTHAHTSTVQRQQKNPLTKTQKMNNTQIATYTFVRLLMSINHAKYENNSFYLWFLVETDFLFIST